MCKNEPDFDPDHPEEYMDHRHDTKGYPKPVIYPKRDDAKPKRHTEDPKP
jgi:hypothetical protein